MLMFNEEIAELVGIMLGDGGIRLAKRGSFLAVFGHSENDKEYLLNFVSKLLEKIFCIKPSVHYHCSLKEIRLQITRKNVIEKAQKLGLIPGDKVRNNVGIPKWIFSNKEFLRACVRGLIDTDGCTYAKWAYPRIPQIEFYSVIPKLQEDFSKAMKILGFKVSKWRVRNGTVSTCGIYGKNEAFKYYQEIGFNNPKNIRRFNKIITCPGSMRHLNKQIPAKNG